MNLFVYFKAPAIQSYKLPGSCKAIAQQEIWTIRKSGLPLSEQESLIRDLVYALHQDESQADAAIKACQQAKAQKSSRLKQPGWLIDLADILLFVPLWIGLYQCLFAVVLETRSFMSEMPVGFGMLLQAVGAWAIVRMLLFVFQSFPTGWKRWLSIAGLFCLYLLMMKATSLIPGFWLIPAWQVLLVCGLVFFLAYILHQQLYQPEKSERRVQ